MKKVFLVLFLSLFIGSQYGCTHKEKDRFYGKKGYSIKIPSGWEKAKNISGIDLIMTSPGGKENPAPRAEIVIKTEYIPKKALFILENFTKKAKRQLSSKSLQKIKTGTSQIGNTAAYTLSGKMLISGKPYYVKNYYFTHRNTLYQIIGAVKVGFEDDFSQIITTTIESIRLNTD